MEDDDKFQHKSFHRIKMTFQFEIAHIVTESVDANQNKMTTKKTSPKSITKVAADGKINDQATSNYIPVPSISQSIMNLQIKLEQLRNSAILKQLIADIFQLNTEVIKIDNKNTSIRHKIVSDLLIHELCIPHLLSLIGVGITIGIISENDKIQVRVKNILVKAFNLLKHSDDHHTKQGDFSYESFMSYLLHLFQNLMPDWTSIVISCSST